MTTITRNKMIEVRNSMNPEEVLTKEALLFLFSLHKEFNQRRKVLLENRQLEQQVFDKGGSPDFPKETRLIRESDWVVESIPADLQDRRVEITGPVDRKMVINGLNSGAKVFMADFEDACSPSWSNLMNGQQNLKEAVDQTISLEQNGKHYRLNEQTAVLVVRPRGLHLEEQNLEFEGVSASGSLVDFGLYFFHNWKTLIQRGTAPYFYLPKLEHYREAAWWNEVFNYAQEYVGLPKGTIKATVLIETITASFQLDEIIYELKDHIAGLNCGRWDYIFSYIKKMKNHSGFMVPDRDQITMTSPFMDAYSKRVIEVCHRRNILAIGGMAAQIPVRNDEAANDRAFAKVKEDKLREVKNGHDGTWVAHPALVPLAKAVFDEFMPTSNQLHLHRMAEVVTQEQLLELPQGAITEAGVRKNLNVGVLYLESWLNGTGAAALYHLMEDAATAEISRAQLWLWLQRSVVLENRRACTAELYREYLAEELMKIKSYVGPERFVSGKFDLAADLFLQMVSAAQLDDFLTLIVYPYIAQE
ncbi:malate synthase A [Fluviicola sp.]|uniref:malate synthase A n=1 Tax=Fluviicola sp. TaxID=1917219 RepID=UPI0031DD5FBB